MLQPRRRALIGTGAAVVAAAVGRSAVMAGEFNRPDPGHPDSDLPPPLVIGVLSDPTGLGAAVSGAPLEYAVRMAVDDTGPLPERRPVALVTGAFRLRSDDAVAIARRWFDQGVSVIIDIPGGLPAREVQAAAGARGRSVLITGSISPELTGADCSPIGSHWSVDSASIARALTGALARRGAKSWFLVAPDTLLGAEMQADMIHAIETAGGRVAGRARHKPELADFPAIADQIAASDATSVVLCDIGPELVAQLGVFRRAGLFSGRTFAAFLPSIVDLHAAGATADGLYLVAAFYWAQNNQSQSFANRFMAATGRMPDPAHAAAYAATRHFLRAVSDTQGLDAVAVNRAMRSTPVYFFGHSLRLRLDGRLAADLSLLRVKAPAAAGGGEWDLLAFIEAIPAASVYPPLNSGMCRVAL